MKFLLEISITIILSHVIHVNGEVTSLCNDPVIHSVDRLVNYTVRLYRGDYYWELRGLPDREAFVRGPYKIPQKNMAPIVRGTSVVTILTGLRKGNTYKFNSLREWYAWNENGVEWAGPAGWGDLPKPNGLSTAFHNGNSSNSQMIGFANDKVYYFNTQHYGFGRDGDRNGYSGGRFGENFPKGITAAFSWPLEDVNEAINYNVYLFRGDKYCVRKYYQTKGSISCDEWRESRELFGCYSHKRRNYGGAKGISKYPADHNVTGNSAEPGPKPNPTKLMGLSVYVIIYMSFIGIFF